MTDSFHHAVSRTTVPRAVLAIVAVFGLSLALGLPQAATRAIVEEQSHIEATPAESGVAVAAPAMWTVMPFVAILGSIALLPLIPATQHWWDSNSSKLLVAVGLSVLVLVYYASMHHAPVVGHWPAHHIVTLVGTGGQASFVRTVLENALLQEYVPFIVLLFSLYTISGGIRIEGDLTADPITNASFLAVGAVLANLIGTTGAAMLLIRPLLETNQERQHVKHTVVMFIFIVCNCGGLLLPIGDPPLFLGYLEGVPFLWTMHLFAEWAMIVGALLVIYVLLDHFVFYHRETIADKERDMEQTDSTSF